MGLYLTMVLYSIPRVISFAPDMMIFDLSPLGYSLEFAFDLLAQLGPEGRAEYLYLQLPLDFIYPITFAAAHAMLICWLLQKAQSYLGKAILDKGLRLTVLPMLGCLFDYLENTGVFLMLQSYPELNETLVGLASIMTILKSFFVTLTYSVILGLVLYAQLLKLRVNRFL